MAARIGSKRQKLVISLGLSCMAVLAVLVVTLLFLNTRTALGSGTGPGGCAPTNGQHCTVKGDSAFVDFSTFSSDGCTFTDANIEPFASLSQPGHVAAQSVYIFISQYNACTGTQLLFASNQDPNTFMPDFTGTVHFGSGLSSATITGTAPMYGQSSTGSSVSRYSGTGGGGGTLLFTTTVNVTLTGYGATTKSVDSQHFHGQGAILNMHFNGSSRNAEGTGTVTDASGNNLAATPTLNANLSDSSSGTVDIFHS
jgi:hypothetical protein